MLSTVFTLMNIKEIHAHNEEERKRVSDMLILSYDKIEDLEDEYCEAHDSNDFSKFNESYVAYQQEFPNGFYFYAGCCRDRWRIIHTKQLFWTMCSLGPLLFKLFKITYLNLFISFINKKLIK